MRPPLERKIVDLDVVARASFVGDGACTAQASSVGDGACMIELAGAFDLYTGPQFERVVLEAMGRGATEVVVDLSDVTFIDSTTIGILMRTRKRLTALRGRLVLVCRDENILRPLNITTLNRLFEIFHSREEALAAIAPELR